jgi:triosephosphate isomerase (TIM)
MPKLVAGNWKMNGLKGEGLALARDLAARARSSKPACEVALCPPATLLIPVGEAVAGSGLTLGAQDCAAESAGAFTGDLSAAMLKDAGCRYVILGHSERRERHGESDALVRAKADAAAKAGLVPIICVGEHAAERKAGRTEEAVQRQLKGSLPGLEKKKLVIAYEPVWAIGSGLTPQPGEVAAVHGLIRRLAGSETRILYGGSVKPDNAGELMAVPGVDGALVGGASLDARDFWAIVAACG